jgi:DNA-binding response OmpR family regulator
MKRGPEPGHRLRPLAFQAACIPRVDRLMGKAEHPMNDFIVLIDDDPAWIQILSELLRRWGYQARSAQTRRDAERLIQTAGARLIVLDVHLRQDSGLDLLRALRRAGCATPVLLISADESLDPQALLACGADGFLAKPFTSLALWRTLQRLLLPPGAASNGLASGPRLALPQDTAPPAAHPC